ncbi:MAG TPA: Ig-like domain-containing protein [Methylomirabilota bacterium]|nr:Ig-like domain-containing protein [Methylomirabilota bacterium]
MKDATGRTGSKSVTVQVSNGTATKALTAAFTSPAGGATVSGTTSVAVSVSGPTEPSHTFKLMVGSTVIGTKTVSGTTTSFSWATTAVANGSRTLSLTVTDPSGRTGSTTRTVTVSNTAAALSSLSVSLTQATTNLVVDGGTYATVSVTGTSGSSNVYKLSIGTKVLSQKTTSSTGPVTLPWDSTTVANGTQTLKALVTDATGRTGSKSITIQVSN